MADYNFTLPIYGVLPRKLTKTGKVKQEPITLNWYRNAHYRVSGNAKKKFKLMIEDQLDSFDPIEGQLIIHYTYYAMKNGTDVDNFVSVVKKFFQDALSESDLIADDNSAVIMGSNERFGGIDKENPRVEARVCVVNEVIREK